MDETGIADSVDGSVPVGGADGGGAAAVAAVVVAADVAAAAVVVVAVGGVARDDVGVAVVVAAAAGVSHEDCGVDGWRRCAEVGGAEDRLPHAGQQQLQRRLKHCERVAAGVGVKDDVGAGVVPAAGVNAAELVDL